MTNLTQYFKKAIPLFVVAVPMLTLDILTKWIVRENIQLDDSISVINGFFYLSHHRNSGAAFGILANQRTLLVLVTIAALIFIFLYSNRYRNSKWVQTALGFVLGGAVGNFLDRLFLGEVVDFLQFGIESKNLFWPTFNVADVSVCIGAGMLIVYLFRQQNQGTN